MARRTRLYISGNTIHNSSGMYVYIAALQFSTHHKQFLVLLLVHFYGGCYKVLKWTLPPKTLLNTHLVMFLSTL